MNTDRNNVAYIDNTNLFKGCKAEGFDIDYLKFRIYLSEKLKVKTAYIFIGYITGNEDMYSKIREHGYKVLFKPTLKDRDGKIKGNCDSELVLQAVRDVYEQNFEKVIVVSGDGDFSCLVSFLLERGKMGILLSPRNKNNCSSLLRKLPVKITYLPDVADLIKRNK